MKYRVVYDLYSTVYNLGCDNQVTIVDAESDEAAELAVMEQALVNAPSHYYVRIKECAECGQ